MFIQQQSKAEHPGVKDVAGNALASDYNWSFTTVAGDITPPTVSSVTPVNGATGGKHQYNCYS